jgi:hypothetical protein
MIRFDSPADVEALLRSLPDHVTRADAAFQARQQLAFRDLAGQPLLAGYDRLPNLGIESVEVSVAVVAEPPSWFRRLLGALFPRLCPARERFRLVEPGDRGFAVRVTGVIRRDVPGAFTVHDVRRVESDA